jgi:hypothetical protein
MSTETDAARTAGGRRRYQLPEHAVTFEDPLADLDEPNLRRLYEYWDAARRGRPMPARADIDPVEFGWALGNLSLIDVLPDGRFRWRLDGTNIVDFFRCDMTGKELDAYPHADAVGRMRENFGKAVETRAPHYFVSRYDTDRRSWRYQTLVLPLSDDGETVNMLLQMLAACR